MYCAPMSNSPFIIFFIRPGHDQNILLYCTYNINLTDTCLYFFRIIQKNNTLNTKYCTYIIMHGYMYIVYLFKAIKITILMFDLYKKISYGENSKNIILTFKCQNCMDIVFFSIFVLHTYKASSNNMYNDLRNKIPTVVTKSV